MLQVQAFTFNPFYENTYIIHDKKQALLIDPGCYEPYERAQITDFVAAQSLTIESIICTHAHIDHILGVSWAQQQFGVPFYLPSKEVPLLVAASQYAASYGFPSYEAPSGYELLESMVVQEDAAPRVTLGAASMTVLFLPGHSPGHIGLYYAPGAWALVGDAIFKESIGRTDLPGGDHDTLLQSIRQHVLTLADATQLYAGHGSMTTVGHERVHNPFLQ